MHHKLKVLCEVQEFFGLKSRGRRRSESRSVSRVLSRTAIPLRQPSLTASSNLPGSSAGHANGSLFGLAPGGVYLATDCYQPRGALLPHLFTLTGTEVLRRLFSVALSVGSRPPGVTWRLALWSPDFPPSLLAEQKETATVRSTLRPAGYLAKALAASADTPARPKHQPACIMPLGAIAARVVLAMRADTAGSYGHR